MVYTIFTFDDVRDLILIMFGVSAFAYLINRILVMLPQAIKKLIKGAKRNVNNNG